MVQEDKLRGGRFGQYNLLKEFLVNDKIKLDIFL